MSNQSKTTRAARIAKIQAAMSKYYGAQPSVRLAGTTYAPADLQKFLQADIAASDATDQAKAAHVIAVQAERQTHAATDPVLRAIRSLVLADHGDSMDAAQVLASFGFSPRTPPKATGAENVAKAAKAAATRAARHTLGPKQKQAITGTTAALAAAAPAAPAAPRGDGSCEARGVGRGTVA